MIKSPQPHKEKPLLHGAAVVKRMQTRMQTLDDKMEYDQGHRLRLQAFLTWAPLTFGVTLHCRKLFCAS